MKISSYQNLIEQIEKGNRTRQAGQSKAAKKQSARKNKTDS